MSEEPRLRDDMPEVVEPIRGKKQKGSFFDGLRAIPPILGCTAGAYILGFQNCEAVKQYVPGDGLNLGYHLAAGSGLYGGWTNSPSRKIASLATLVAAHVPEIALLSQDGDLRTLGTAAGVKIVGYGLGYVVGHLFSGK